MPRPSHWRRDATNALHLLQHEVNRLLDAYLPQSEFGATDAPPTNLEPIGWSPAVDVFETPDEIVVVAEVPGVDPSSIDLSIAGNTLSLRGIKESGDLPEADVPVRERVFGAFHRQITLPKEVDLENAAASANQGILRVRLPKRSSAKPRTIPIRLQ